MLFRIANREDTDQKQSDLGVRMSRSFWQATSVRNFRSHTVGND